MVAAFLLSWWSSSLCGGFPVSDACVDEDVARDILTALAFALRTRLHPSCFGLPVEPLIHQWRREVERELDTEYARLVAENAASK